MFSWCRFSRAPTPDRRAVGYVACKIQASLSEVGGKCKMRANYLWLGLALTTFLLSGCSGSPWQVGAPITFGTQDGCVACENNACPGGSCTGHVGSTWYPGKHLIRGFHHACSLFTCYGCGGNCYCGQACNAGGIHGWETTPGEITVEQQLEPISAANQAAASSQPPSQNE